MRPFERSKMGLGFNAFQRRQAAGAAHGPRPTSTLRLATYSASSKLEAVKTESGTLYFSAKVRATTLDLGNGFR